MLSVVTDEPTAEDMPSFNKIVLEGAQRMPVTAVRAATDAYVDALRVERGHRLVVRNGYAGRRRASNRNTGHSVSLGAVLVAQGGCPEGQGGARGTLPSVVGDRPEPGAGVPASRETGFRRRHWGATLEPR